MSITGDERLENQGDGEENLIIEGAVNDSYERIGQFFDGTIDQHLYVDSSLLKAGLNGDGVVATIKAQVQDKDDNDSPSYLIKSDEVQIIQPLMLI